MAFVYYQRREFRQRAKDGKIRSKDLMDESEKNRYDDFIRLAEANSKRLSTPLWGCRIAAGGKRPFSHITLHNEPEGGTGSKTGAALGVCMQ